MPELTRRYVVMAMASEAPFDNQDPDGVFVLKPWKDPAALRALVAYRDNCYPELGRDLDAWIQVIEAGPVVRGDVGQRNEPHLKRGAARPRAAAAKTGGRTASRRRGARASASRGRAKAKKRRR
ncbi:MAG TPA: hypothetical protein VGL09_12940 [Methylomirabilota bacterium]|jgi:hypothetical protein